MTTTARFSSQKECAGNRAAFVAPFRALSWPLRLLVFAFLLASAAHAQSAHWEPSASGDPAELQLVFQDCAPSNDTPQLPQIPATTLSYQGISSQTSIVNFSVSRSTILTYRVRASHPGPVSIPAFDVDTNKGTIHVPAFTGGAAIRSAAQIDVKALLEPGHTTVWAGEVFPLDYTLDAAPRVISQVDPRIDWNAAPLVTEEWSKLEQRDTAGNGQPRLDIVSHSRAYAKTPGPVTLNAASQLVSVQIGNVGFGLFQMPRIEQLTVTSNTPSLLVRPLPPPPNGFNGAVGQFKLTSKVVPAQAAVGEPITWTLELSGTGNWPDLAGLPQREVSKDFSVVQPKARRTPAEGKLFDVTLSEDVVLVPTRAGDYTLGPVEFVYFDPATGTYKTLTTPRTSIAIAPPASTPAIASGGAVPSPREPAAQPAPELDPSKLASLKSRTPALPAGLPRDPLPGSEIAPQPLAPRTLLLWIVSPFAAVLLLWWILAYREARKTDPLLPRRQARLRLASTLAGLKRSQPSTLNPQLLLHWQHDTAVLFQIPHAAPPASALTDPAWSRLWSEADAALYSSSATLPSDWTARAEAALAAKTLPGLSPFRLFLPQNLFPFVALLTVALLPFATAAETSKSSSPAEIYREGDFPAAERLWRASLAAHPADAFAHHNLALALAQQDRFGEAAAHAAAAFVQSPAETALRSTFLFTADKAGAVPTPLARFVTPGPLESLARHAAPPEWQRVIVAAALAAAISLAVLLFNAYGPRRLLIRRLAALFFAFSLLLGVAAATGVHAYGLIADARAVVTWRPGTLRSIPTEADNTQKTTTLAPGSVAVVDNTYLSWVRLNFENGQTGWVRQEEVVPFWRPAKTTAD